LAAIARGTPCAPVVESFSVSLPTVQRWLKAEDIVRILRCAPSQVSTEGSLGCSCATQRSRPVPGMAATPKNVQLDSLLHSLSSSRITVSSTGGLPR
jgi:hypothetical protein